MAKISTATDEQGDGLHSWHVPIWLHLGVIVVSCLIAGLVALLGARSAAYLLLGVAGIATLSVVVFLLAGRRAMRMRIRGQ
jgi:hypothetical protein